MKIWKLLTAPLEASIIISLAYFAFIIDIVLNWSDKYMWRKR